MPIRVITTNVGLVQMKASFSRNWKHYLQEALGLAIFMVSSCFFTVLLEAPASSIHMAITDQFTRTVLAGLLMGGTALFIFYSPFTSPSGSQINPAVTISFLWLGKMCHWDAVFYIIAQFFGGTLAVYLMQEMSGDGLINLPVNSVATIPGKSGILPAVIIEFVIAFITMLVVLVTSSNARLKKYTRLFAGCLVCCWVIIAGPVSGFGMNPARSFASALPANTWTSFWIYLLMPVLGMLSAAEVFVLLSHKKWIISSPARNPEISNN
jgi:aquaporin Z